MRRREFVTIVGGSALASAFVARPITALSQQDSVVRCIGVLMGFSGPEAGRPYTITLEKNLQAQGWTVGENLEIHYRWPGSDARLIQASAQELVSLRPDALLATGSGSLAALSKQTSTIPIAFIQVTNPDKSGFVANLSRPGGNITGISNPDVSILSDRIKLLKELVPRMTRLLVLFNPDHHAATSSLRIVDATASILGIQVSKAGVRENPALERAIDEFARAPNGGMLVIPSTFFSARREQIVGMAAKHYLPSIFHIRSFAVSGGLASLGVDQMAMYAEIPAYLDRIFRGEKPADLPVQEPSKSQLIINLKVAKHLGIEVPGPTIARADEVIRE
jgi:putative ABC transport system substrate-binding protein